MIYGAQPARRRDAQRNHTAILLAACEVMTSPRPVVGKTMLPVALDGRHVVIVDAGRFTGRTIRAALDELADFGRPARVALAVLIDRGGRELPIQPDVVGTNVEAPTGARGAVLVKELDGRDEVVLTHGGAS